ncbi:restriction endonuclease subunit S [Xanthomonas oryzae]|uniref:restriction endonuclease subunit S n=1 Tax=Xanthomonas oryzae TaxID=347 RepID=UPI001C52F913|nr:restriction endonuclease subunit S [Xanthomonas oryzae]
MEVEIGDLCELVNGRAFKPQEWCKEGLPIIRIQNLNRPDAAFNFFKGELDPRHFVVAGQLLFAWSGTPGTSFGAHIWNGPSAALNQHIFKIEFDTEQLDKTFFRHAINQKLDELIGSAQGGVGLRHVTKVTFERTQITLPPLVEQKRIAQKLDALLAQVDTLKARIDAIPALLKRFRQSVLSAAVSGRLTSQTAHGSTQGSLFQPPLVFFASEQGEKPVKWKWEKLADLATLESGHTPRKSVPAYWEGGDVPWISLQDIRAADGKEISETKFKPTMLGIQNSSARLLPKGTVCFSRDISVGFVTVMGRSMATTQHFANWICGNELSPKYLMYAFMAGRDHLLKSGQGSTVKTIYMPALKELRLRLPPLSEQIEIVRRVEQLFAYADQLEAKVAVAQQRIDALTQSLLAKAFRGELVPQDPSDEPASVLLDRIRTQRAAAPKPKRGRKAATS